VTGDALATLLALAPRAGLERLRELLADAELRDLALLAPGESRLVDAILGFLAETVLTEERAVAFTALAIHRSEPALRELLAWLPAQPKAVLAALRVRRRFEADVRRRVREVAEDLPEELLATLDA
jgi:hypothetical protein